MAVTKLLAVSVSEIGQHIVGIHWHMFEVIVCHFKRASLSSRVVKEIYSLNNVETNLKTPHAHACSSAKSVHARACTFKALLHAFSFGVLIPLSTFLVPSCIQSDCVLSRSKSDDDTVSYIWPFRSSPNSPRLRL